ncbi:MAG: Rhodanese domain protein [Chitinophagaceae bacterium]|nr:Rhodanese domain protein [Chitinophagaceae bacterium]
MKKVTSIIAVSISLLLHTALQAQTVESKQELISFETFETKLKQASPNAQVLDARTAEEYKLNHLIGAVNVSVANEAELQQQIDKLDKSKPVFVYSINNGRSASLAKKLRAQKFSEVYDLPGGISRWIGEGRPVASTTAKGLTLEEYNQLLKSDKLVLVDVHSKYCGSCRKLSPIVDSVATEKSSELKVIKIELFENKQLGDALNIQSIPTLILYNGDKIVWQKSGLTSKASIEEAIRLEVASLK